MSKEEMKKQDEELIRMVNGEGGEDKKPQGTDVVVEGSPQKAASDASDPVDDQKFLKWRRRNRIKAIWKIVGCILAAGLLLLALFVPAALPMVVHTGVICFAVAAAITFDRNLRSAV